MSAKKELPDVRPGQIWADNDKRMVGRKVKVIEVDPRDGEDPHAIVEVIANADGAVLIDPKKPRRTRIAVRRFVSTSTGYRLLEDV